MAPAQGVAAYLPTTLPLDHAGCFGIVDEGSLDFAAAVQRFANVAEAEAQLEALGWEDGAYRHFGCDGPPDGGAGWIDISVHRFRDPASAAAAVPFFVDSRLSNTSLEETLAPILGDHAAALTGPASNGTKYSLYVSSGSLFFRVIGVAPVGVPAADVQQVMAGLVVESAIVGQGETSSAQVTSLPTATLFPLPTLRPTAPPAPTSTPVLVPTATTVPTPQPTSTVPASTECQRVELYPGYPGFRGYVAGVDGPAEVACLSDLIAADPGFDKTAEDAANLAAARAIGLGGSFADWTWENWMAVEAERGLPPTCYSCLFRGDEPEPDRETAPWDATDPRLQMGGYETTDALAQAAARAGMGSNSTAFLVDSFRGDHVLRAFIGATWPGHHTAREILGAYDEVLAGYAGEQAVFFDPGLL